VVPHSFPRLSFSLNCRWRRGSNAGAVMGPYDAAHMMLTAVAVFPVARHSRGKTPECSQLHGVLAS
jgi:hypothetical protein